MTSLRLDKLVLTNFRCFAHCEIDLHPRLTVLVAENAHGKTTLLDAISLALSVYVSALQPTEKQKTLQRTDVRLVRADASGMVPCLPSGFSIDGIVADQTVHWASALPTYGTRSRPSTRELKQVQHAAQALRNDNAILPLVAFYGTGRLWGEHRLTEGRRTSVTSVSERLGGYADCLTSSSSFKGVSAWYEHRVKETKSPAYQENLATNLALLTAVREAARIVLEPTGWSNLDWDFELGDLVADHAKHGRLPLSSLSDGVRNMLALVADVARRCASLNPQLGEDSARKTPGVLLIDEVDMHLHPRWQQLIIPRLQEAFPLVQIIVTTHSPQVLTTVPSECIRILRDNKVYAAPPGTEGAEPERLLRQVLGLEEVRPSANPATQELKEYLALVDRDQWSSPRALELRRSLDKRYQGQEPALLDADLQIENRKWELGE